MRSLTKTLVVMLLILVSIQSFSQVKDKGSFDLGLDLMSRYTWRGIDYGEDPSVQPFLSYTKGGLEIGYWGAYAFNFEGFQETDLYLSYTFMNEMLTVGVIDYFYPDIVKGHILGQDYFKLDNDITAHTLEASLAFNGTEKIPLSFAAYSCVYGADKVVSNITATDTSFKNNYSTYIEVGYSTSVQDVSLDLFAGYLLNGVDLEDSDIDGGEGFYLDGPGFINFGMTASKDVKVTEYLDLPISTSLMFNPKRERIFFIVGISF